MGTVGTATAHDVPVEYRPAVSRAASLIPVTGTIHFNFFSKNIILSVHSKASEAAESEIIGQSFPIVS